MSIQLLSSPAVWIAVVSVAQVGLEDHIRQLDSPNYFDRVRAAESLGEIGVDARSAIPDLLCLIEREMGDFDRRDWHIRQAAAEALTKIGTSSIAELIEFIEEESPALPCRLPPNRDHDLAAELVAFSLAAMGEVALPSLIHSFEASTRLQKERRTFLRERIAIALASAGASSAIAVPALGKALSDDEWRIRWAAARALEEIGSPAVSELDALIAALSDPEYRVRHSAILALAAIGNLAVGAVPFLEESAAEEESRELREAALNAIALIQANR